MKMKTVHGLISSALVLALLTAPLSASAAGLLGRALHKLETGKRDNGPPGGSVKISKPESFKGATQVVIGQFSVGFFTKNVNYGDNSVFSSASGIKTTGILTGVGATEFQAITDAAYDDFKQKLTAHGITIVDPAAYVANQNYARAKPNAQGAKAKIQLDEQDSADAVIYWPTQLGRTDNAITLLSGWDNIASSGYIISAQKDYSKSSGIPVMNVQLLIDFAEPIKTKTSASDVSATTNARIAISNYGSQVSMLRGTDSAMSRGASIVMQSPIVQEGQFAELSGKTTNLGSQAVGFLTGIKVQGQGKFSVAVTDPAAYRTTVLAATTKAADLFLGEMEKLR
jgi:hypothetical protein